MTAVCLLRLGACCMCPVVSVYPSIGGKTMTLIQT